MNRGLSTLGSYLPTSLRRLIRRIKEGADAKRYELQRWWRRPHLFAFGNRIRIGTAFRYDTHLSDDERVMLYALVRGLQPERVLEIGTHHGASAAIIAAAMEDNGRGRLIGLDPQPCVTVPAARFFGRFELISARSPEGIAAARERAGGPFDLIHWDCVVIYDQARRDLNGLLPYLAENSYLLINNPMHAGVHRAVCEMIEEHDNWHDCGYLCRQVIAVESDPVAHRGLQLIRIDASRTADPRPHVERAFARDGLEMLKSDLELLNHDPWYCRAVKACPWCESRKTIGHEPSRSALTNTNSSDSIRSNA